MMTPNKKTFLAVGLVFFGLLSSKSFSDVKYYESGLGRDWDFWDAKAKPTLRLNETEAISEFLKANFSALGRESEWRKRKITGDSTHTHHFYHYYYKGRRVEGVGLAIHYNRNGWVEYADSDLERNISLDFEADSPQLRARIAETLNKELKERFGREYGSYRWEPILWRGEGMLDFVAAYHVAVLYTEPYEEKNLVVDQKSGRILDEFKKVRLSGRDSLVRTSVQVFKNNFTDSQLIETDISSKDPDSLTSDYVKVYREQGSRFTYVKKKITPFNYGPSGSNNYSADPDTYSSFCVGDETSNTDCTNQAFDGVNVFYHVNGYRGRLDNYLIEMGNKTTFPDPLTVFVNSRPRGSFESDNAFYINKTDCGYGEERCLAFLPPTGTCDPDGNPKCTVPGCNDKTVLNNLAREGFVISHEYQHYITDILSGIEFTAHSKTTVGDALHEGYSDYGAATYLSFVHGADVTLGLVAFPTCSNARRDVGVFRAYSESFTNTDSHMSGLSWASGLWKLRNEFDPEVADLIAFKSLYFLGTNPGFIVAVESLVKADRALFDGLHEERIRELFYTELKFTGSSGQPFKNPETFEANVGFRGCSGVFPMGSENGSFTSGIVFLIWGLVTLGLGRLLNREMST